MEDWEKRLHEGKMMTVLEWEVPKEEFKRQVREFINKCQVNSKTIPLPVPIQLGHAFMGQLALLLSQVNCEGCTAICCKRGPGESDEGIELGYDDRLRLDASGKDWIVESGSKPHLNFPCPFLKKNNCEIYEMRPFVCVLFPFQPGGWDGNDNMLLSVASYCPEGRRIARNVYLTTWRLRGRMLANKMEAIIK